MWWLSYIIIYYTHYYDANYNEMIDIHPMIPPTATSRRPKAHRFAVAASLQRLADAELRVERCQCEDGDGEGIHQKYIRNCKPSVI